MRNLLIRRRRAAGAFTLLGWAVVTAGAAGAGYAPTWLLAISAGFSGCAAALLSRAWTVSAWAALAFTLGLAATTASSAALWVQPWNAPAPVAWPDLDQQDVDGVEALDAIVPDPYDSVASNLRVGMDLEAPTAEKLEAARRALTIGNEASYQRGRKDAQRDVARGILRLHSYGLPVFWHGEYGHILSEEYGIESRAVAGCMASSEIVGHTRGYNDVMHQAIADKYDDGLLDRVSERAARATPDPFGAL